VKIVLVRVDGLGDALVCAPLIAALRDAGHEVSAVLGPGNRDAFTHRTFAHVHELERIPWPKHGSTKESRSNALEEMKAARYEVALIASEELDAYQLAKDAGIPRRVGFTNGWEKPLKSFQINQLLTHKVQRPASGKHAAEHEVETIFRLGERLHGEAAPTRDLQRLVPLLLDGRVRKSDYVAVQVSGKNESHGLDKETYVALGRQLRRTGFDVMLLGNELSLLNAVGRAANVMEDPLLSLSDWKERIAAGMALITPDSGAAHVSGMIGIPTIDCFGGGPNVNVDMRRWAPWAAPNRCLALTDAPPDFMAGALVGELLDLLQLQHHARR